MDLFANPLRRTIAALGAIALTSAAYLMSSGLNRNWWPLWLAPIPILLLAPKVRTWEAFAIAVIARGVGSLNLWNYAHKVVQLPVWLSLATVLVPAILFALAITLYRNALRQEKFWRASLVFPVMMVAEEYVVSLSQGTFLSAGYTQIGNLPILQLAGITGIWGISFVVNLFPAVIASLAFAPAKVRLRMAGVFLVVYASVLTYGAVRLSSTLPSSNSVLVGLVETHGGPNLFPSDGQNAISLLKTYAAQVKPLADRGAQFVIFPEMTAVIPDSVSAEVDALFEKTAHDAHVQVLIGILHVTNDHHAFNEGRLYSETGEIETVYRKHHLVPTWESRSSPGTEISVLKHQEGKIGIEICRDMDYPELARRYAKQGVGLILVPAWDQGVGVDADWHGHMSLMRGVEGGFAMVRDAKNGLLTASDNRGRVLAEEPTRSDGALVSLLARVPLHHELTLYQAWGDWFAWVDLAVLAALLATNRLPGLLRTRATAS